MNTLDIILIGTILLGGLSGKYEGINTQVNKLISIALSVMLAKLFLYPLISIFYPFIGLSNYTKPIIYYSSMGIFYLSITIIIKIIFYHYEQSTKNKLMNSLVGFFLSCLNTILILSVALSISLSVMNIPSSILKKLNESRAFIYVDAIRIILIDYEK